MRPDFFYLVHLIHITSYKLYLVTWTPTFLLILTSTVCILLQSSQIMDTYLFHYRHDTKTYLKMYIDKHLKIIITRFRLGISDIAVHHCRYKRHTDRELICPLCRVAQETELHFVLCCPVLRTLRAQFIPLKFYKFPSLFRLSLLLASTNENIVRNLSVYLYKTFKLRSISMS